jgi:hypothetical protein
MFAGLPPLSPAPPFVNGGAGVFSTDPWFNKMEGRVEWCQTYVRCCVRIYTSKGHK